MVLRKYLRASREMDIVDADWEKRSFCLDQGRRCRMELQPNPVLSTIEKWFFRVEQND